MPTAAPYAAMPDRPGAQGIADKLALVDAMAWTHAVQDRALQELTLRVLSGAGNGADAQVRAIEAWAERLPYRREPGEILRDPMQTARHGGDCDDHVVLVLAMLRAVGIPCRPEILARDGHGFHIRSLVGLPPLAPAVWVPIDTVRDSEAQWAMAGRAVRDLAPRSGTAQKLPALAGARVALAGLAPATPSTGAWLAIGAVILGAWALS